MIGLAESAGILFALISFLGAADEPLAGIVRHPKAAPPNLSSPSPYFAMADPLRFYEDYRVWINNWLSNRFVPPREPDRGQAALLHPYAAAPPAPEQALVVLVLPYPDSDILVNGAYVPSRGCRRVIRTGVLGKGVFQMKITAAWEKNLRTKTRVATFLVEKGSVTVLDFRVAENPMPALMP